MEYDLRDLDGIPDLIADLGEIHVLVNNAGTLLCPSPERLTTHGELGFTDEQTTAIMTVNVRAPAALIEALAPQMCKRGLELNSADKAAHAAPNDGIGGRIVNVASVSAYTGHPDLWYGASKAALLNITKTFASLLGKNHVVVNAVVRGCQINAVLIVS